VLQVRLGVRGVAAGLLTVLTVAGMGAVHEIVEAGSTAVLGAETGMLHVGPEDPYDTQQDMLNNVLGAALRAGAAADRARAEGPRAAAVVARSRGRPRMSRREAAAR
jgi:uncharacterized membrane protein YjdF